MNLDADLLDRLPLFYNLGAALLLYLVLESLYNYRKKVWALPALTIYITTGFWYFIELVYTPEYFTQFSREIIELGYLQVFIFLVLYRIFLPFLVQKCVYQFSSTLPKIDRLKLPRNFQPDRVLIYITIVWLVLLAFGTTRLNGDLLGALFPIQSRAGVHMWGRAAGADAGATGFIISSASYTYLLVCSFFCILLPLQTKKNIKLVNTVLISCSLPYYIFMGSRNLLLAAIVPGIISYILFSRNQLFYKVIVCLILLLVLNFVLQLVIQYRNIGFQSYFENFGNPSLPEISSPDKSSKHLGLNMMQELCYINTFLQEKSLKLSYGGRYIAELANIIPRAIWANKPLVGIDYAILRGFGSSRNDIGVFATISTGFIGQGVINFGSDFGAIAPAFLMALWTGFLSRLWVQRASTLRKGLFLVGLGLTFNLGRDITLLVLWPIVFGYVLVRILENMGNRSRHSF